MILSAENINFSFEAGRQIISDVSIHVPENFFLGIAGPNGSGKTTLLRLLSGALKPDSGKISVMGGDINFTGLREKAKTISIVPAEQYDCGKFSVEDIVLMGRAASINWWRDYSAQDFDITRQVLNEMGLADFAKTDLGCLSTGERQKVFIAQALCQKPKLLILDEPTAHLDLHAQGEIFALIKKLSAEGVSIIAVSHDINLLSQYCGGIAILKEGKLRAFGSPDKIVGADIIKEIYGVEPLIFINPSNKRPFVNIPEL